jgi:hypothetical protein
MVVMEDRNEDLHVVSKNSSNIGTIVATILPFLPSLKNPLGINICDEVSLTYCLCHEGGCCRSESRAVLLSPLLRNRVPKKGR